MMNKTDSRHGQLAESVLIYTYSCSMLRCCLRRITAAVGGACRMEALFGRGRPPWYMAAGAIFVP